MGADACPVPEGERSWLSHWEKLATEPPVNGGCNYSIGVVVKFGYMLEPLVTLVLLGTLYKRTSYNVTSRDNQQERAL